jgi:hypothetical protein
MIETRPHPFGIVSKKPRPRIPSRYAPGRVNFDSIMNLAKSMGSMVALLLAGVALLAAPASGRAADATNSTNAISLFNGKDLTGWEVIDYGARGPTKVEKGEMIIGMGELLTGVSLTNKALVPSGEYEVNLDAKRVEGSDFFCAVTFPVAKSSCTLIVGGWGGGVVGLSSINGMDASENSYTQYRSFEKDKWYHIRLAVTPKRIQFWLDQEQVFDADIEGKKISLRPGEIYRCEPFGLATYQTTAAIRNLNWRPLPPAK